MKKINEEAARKQAEELNEFQEKYNKNLQSLVEKHKKELQDIKDKYCSCYICSFIVQWRGEKNNQ